MFVGWDKFSGQTLSFSLTISQSEFEFGLSYRGLVWDTENQQNSRLVFPFDLLILLLEPFLPR